MPISSIQQRIHIVRGRRVMLDADLARFYRVTTFNLNKAVSRNAGRFPDDFAFVLTLVETRDLIFQTGISNPGRGGVRKPARVFTEQGVAMLASVLRSARALPCSEPGGSRGPPANLPRRPSPAELPCSHGGFRYKAGP